MNRMERLFNYIRTECGGKHFDFATTDHCILSIVNDCFGKDYTFCDGFAAISRTMGVSRDVAYALLDPWGAHGDGVVFVQGYNQAQLEQMRQWNKSRWIRYAKDILKKKQQA